jgi:hypothetical protein
MGTLHILAIGTVTERGDVVERDRKYERASDGEGNPRISVVHEGDGATELVAAPIPSIPILS